MDEARATYCFCGCGTRIKHPRLVVTNTNGWELSDELGEWAKMQFFSDRIGLDLSGSELAENIDRGQKLWRDLREAMHSGERADKDDEKTAVMWRKHAKKARRKLRKQYRRDGLPDPFDMPALNAPELAAWITEGVEPRWAVESEDVAEEESLGFRLVSRAAELSDTLWEWDETPGVAVAKTADALSEFREDYNLVLDAIALGYWIRQAELELTEGFNTFDSSYIEEIREKFTEEEPDTILQIAMNQVRENLPDPFAQGPEVWAEVVALSVTLLTARGRQMLIETSEFDEDFDISDERREFALGLGYGLGLTASAIGIEATRPRE
jgi:hypothetical protein